MKKRIIAMLMVAFVMIGLLAGCGGGGDEGGAYVGTDTVSNEYTTVTINGYEYKKALDITEEEITLTYFHFDQDETVQKLAEVFMQIYPNITVVATYENVATYGDTLLTQVASQNTPDVIMYSDCDFALSNQMLSDISSYWDSDEETKNLAPTINDAGLGTFNLKGGQRYAVPVKFFPGVIYVDLHVLDTLNLERPTQNWTWDEMIQLIKDSTVLDSPDGIAYYGLGVYNRLDSYYGIAAAQTIIGEFGFDGTEFDLSAWAVGEQQFSDLKLSGYVAPAPQTYDAEDWLGDFDAWFGASGHVAVLSEAFWTFQGTWNLPSWQSDFTMDIVPYVIPAVSDDDAGADHHSIATIDYGGITTSCKYRREAYELLKFMSFGVDGWMTRIALYNDETFVNAAGNPLKYDVMPAPITLNEDVWEAYIAMYTNGMDEEHVAAWEEYFASCMQPISFGWTSIAGYWNFCDEYFNSIGIHDLVDTGAAQAADYVEEATRKANYYHAQAMLDYFGPDGYNVLSEEEIALYEKMVAENG